MMIMTIRLGRPLDSTIDINSSPNPRSYQKENKKVLILRVSPKFFCVFWGGINLRIFERDFLGRDNKNKIEEGKKLILMTYTKIEGIRA